ncbi:hypothetical protein E3N88_30571 [Mikania micrantha]|uniref:Reverse transcriptase Ty1/copia-type domain-containing protein n=1 Tax=Mikania micrantha TaxID=192012 RepID=A0A5N6MP92_9ASTR|nr:hypothetical protein E3N88_30571 [Mikania micrantha]
MRGRGNYNSIMALKTLADQLANVGHPVSNQRLVAQGSSTTALNVSTQSHQDTYTPSPKTERGDYSKNCGRGYNRGRGRGRGRSNGGRSRGSTPQWTIGWVPVQGNGPFIQQPNQRPWSPPQWVPSPSQQWAPNSQWTSPPCPYPSTPRPRPTNPSNFAGILGAHPQQSYAPSEITSQPTDIEQTLYTISCDHSLLIYKKEQDTAYLLLYVDDIILVTSSETLRHHLMSQLADEFAMKDLGPLSYFLGVSVQKYSDDLFLSQQKYALEIINQAGMSSCKPAATPVDTNGKLSAAAGDPVPDPTFYRSLAGALQYLTFTRPDITYAIQQICMHMHDPRSTHFNALNRIIRYIQGTSHYGLHMTNSSAFSLLAYIDADWAGCPDTRRSTSANVVAEICWIRNLLLELHHASRTSLVYCDNVSAICLSGNPVQHQRTKHIEMDIHFVREKVQRGLVRVLHVSSRFQIAYIFTKGLPRVLFEDFRSSLSIRSPPASTAGSNRYYII